jgi:hypothetical protein
MFSKELSHYAGKCGWTTLRIRSIFAKTPSQMEIINGTNGSGIILACKRLMQSFNKPGAVANTAATRKCLHCFK